MIQPEELVGGAWYRFTPVQRWLESEKLWQTYLALGGSLDPEPDTQSPLEQALASEESAERERDRQYWLPLRAEMEKLGILIL